ncbi:light-harvesting antenna LH1, alpha subunit [Lamprobacter modestohalophilus]|uniref:Light-harvesting protein n=1 Tax=Lamprobacter modestohalophilus TaxID=1064514 RepID=A0A9X1B500_9GAMM|nr:MULTISPECIES: light-harvesting antenna LH1, alpha subunit [Chromatiaceae]MCF7976858.1 light-harvesting protein [Chromatiaceae bacterium]MBK1619172.1 light-harvesting protein [Lamprobacter modestohalophilus]MBK5937813.1 light-harvesting protein [Halochromatium roseum]MCF7996125.1 light-harvesting protein [Chromatiaceae bacterium]MCF8003251.1 light-harvesting protein [Chromatiaceae bacterium]
MHRIWQIFDPRRSLIGLMSFLFALALVIHFMLLMSPAFNWLGNNALQAPASSMSAMPPTRTIN